METGSAVRRVIVGLEGFGAERLLERGIELAIEHDSALVIVGGDAGMGISAASPVSGPAIALLRQQSAVEVLAEAVASVPDDVSVTFWLAPEGARRAIGRMPELPGDVRLTQGDRWERAVAAARMLRATLARRRAARRVLDYESVPTLS
ncbi:MAG TPA: hypothetical protein VNT55_20380 [Baekduia sp.]|nr:hypothetical protein [Baekduia sp.]